jgi:hypothetical protein
MIFARGLGCLPQNWAGFSALRQCHSFLTPFLPSYLGSDGLYRLFPFIAGIGVFNKPLDEFLIDVEAIKIIDPFLLNAAKKSKLKFIFCS